ncbi:13802_t:CDS:2, partial [Dentiscutata heterogama]
RLAAKYPVENQLVSGIIVSKDFEFNIMDPNDLKDFNRISTSAIIQKQTIAYYSSFSLLKYHLEQLKSQVQLEWSSTPMNDNIADSVLEVSLNIESSPASVKIRRIYSKDDSKDEIIIKTDDRIVEVNLSTLEVKTDDDVLRNRITQYYARFRPCCGNPEFTVLMFGEISNLSINELEDWLKSQSPFPFIHIKKKFDSKKPESNPANVEPELANAYANTEPEHANVEPELANAEPEHDNPEPGLENPEREFEPGCNFLFLHEKILRLEEKNKQFEKRIIDLEETSDRKKRKIIIID